MKIDKSVFDGTGIEWRVAGYSSPRIRNHAPVYRLIRMTDGSRVRVKSHKMYWLEVSRNLLDVVLPNINLDTNMTVRGGGARSIEWDWDRVGFKK